MEKNRPIALTFVEEVEFTSERSDSSVSERLRQARKEIHGVKEYEDQLDALLKERHELINKGRTLTYLTYFYSYTNLSGRRS